MVQNHTIYKDRSSKGPSLKKKLWIVALGSCLLSLWFWHHHKTKPYILTTQRLAVHLSRHLDKKGTMPDSIKVPSFENKKNNNPLIDLSVESTLDSFYSETVRKYLERYKCDYASIAIINPDTGAILALDSYTKDPLEKAGHLAIKSDFPAASVFKIVTAAAAIDKGHASSETLIPFNGRSHTLYKKNVKENDVNRWTRQVTLKEAFGKSINTVFGKLGLFHVGTQDLSEYAEAFYFNKRIPSDLSIEKSKFVMDPTDTWELVESSAGFTNRTTLSPIHGALIAAAILNNGTMPQPFVVNNVRDNAGASVYESKPQTLREVMSKTTASQMQSLMEETIVRGTSRKAFRGLAHHRQDMLVGGKTGSLDGETLQGRTDWFVGYVSHEDVRLAVGIVTVHKKYWTVKSSVLARLIFEDIFRQKERERRALASQ